MVEQYQELQDALVAFDTKTNFLYFLERTPVLTLVIYSTDSNREFLRKALPQGIEPTEILPNRDYLAVVGKNEVHVLCIKRAEEVKSLDSKQQVKCVQWHPLNENFIGVLTGNGQLNLYDLEGDLKQPQLFDLNLGWTDDTVVAFQFLGESPLTLMRFCCLLLTTNGHLYALSPVSPKVFATTQDFEVFGQVLSATRSTYLKQEPRLNSWFSSVMQALRAADPDGAKKHYNLAPEHFRSFAPILRRVGTLNTAGYFQQLVLLHSANPSVVAVISREGKVCLCVGFGDIVPRFSQTEPEDFYGVYEEIDTDSYGCLVLGEMNKLYYLSATRLHQIYIPWLAEMQESVKKKTSSQVFRESVIELTEVYSNHSGMTLVQRGSDNNFVVIPQEKHLEVVPFKAINPSHSQEALQPLSLTAPSRLRLERLEVAPLPECEIQIEDFSNEHEELASFQKMLRTLVTMQMKPLDERMNFLNSRIRESRENSDTLQKELSTIVPTGLSKLEQSFKRIEDRLRRCRDRAEWIESTANEILNKQKRIRRPLSGAERQCYNELCELIDRYEILMSASQKVKLYIDSRANSVLQTRYEGTKTTNNTHRSSNS